MCFYSERLEDLIKNSGVKDELIRRYNKAGWDISVKTVKKEKEMCLVVEFK